MPALDTKCIIFIDHSPTLGGASRVLLDLLSIIDRREVSPLVVCAAGSEIIPFVTELGIPVETAIMPWFSRTSGSCARLLYLYRIVAFALFLGRLVIKHQAEVIHANNFIAVLYAALPAKILRRPLVWHMHDILAAGWFNALFVNYAAWGATQIICVSEATRAELLKFRIDAGKCRIIYNYLRSRTLSGETPRRTLREEFTVPDGNKIVGMVGNICRLKGQLIFLGAAREILLLHRDVTFMLVGTVNNPVDVPYRSAVDEYLRTNELSGQVILTGFRTDAPELIAEMDILVHPPILPESFGLVLLEAMVAGVPVIASEIGGIPEIVSDGVNGVLVPPDDIPALVAAVNKLLCDSPLRQRLGAAGKQTVATKFRADLFASEFAEVYRQLLGGRRVTECRNKADHHENC